MSEDYAVQSTYTTFLVRLLYYSDATSFEHDDKPATLPQYTFYYGSDVFILLGGLLISKWVSHFLELRGIRASNKFNAKPEVALCQ